MNRVDVSTVPFCDKNETNTPNVLLQKSQSLSTMNRRNFIQLGLAATAGLVVPAHGAETLTSSTPSHPKRGLGITTKPGSQWREKLERCGARWFYSWGPIAPKSLPNEVKFAPMIYGRTGVELQTKIGEILKQQGSQELLGFNEPDSKEQSDLKVEQALELWPELMKLGLRMGSPGCVHPDKEWMRAFMKGVAEKNLRVDFVSVHDYGGLNVDGLMNRLEAVHEEYQRPLWITELGVGDWEAKTRAENRYQPDEIVKFLEQLLPRLDQCEFIERYAWFPAKPDNAALGPCALFNEDGSLTPVGQAYRSV